MVLKKDQIITAQAMTGAITSSIVDISGLDNIGIQLNFTGTPTGSFVVEVSADHQENIVGGAVVTTGNWASILPAISALAVSGSAGSLFVNIPSLSAPFIRVRYVFTSGTGSLDAFICGKKA